MAKQDQLIAQDIAEATLAWSNAFHDRQDVSPSPPPFTTGPTPADRSPHMQRPDYHVRIASSSRFFSPLSLLKIRDTREDSNLTTVDEIQADLPEISNQRLSAHAPGSSLMPFRETSGATGNVVHDDGDNDLQKREQPHHKIAGGFPTSTLYPSSLRFEDRDQPGQSDHNSVQDVEQHREIVKDEEFALRAIREGLGWLPTETLAAYSRDELEDLIFKAILNVGKSDEQLSAKIDSDQANSSSSINHENAEASSLLQEGEKESQRMTAHEWFEAMTGSMLPSGWIAEYDYDQSAWYFIDFNKNPPVSTWKDPRMKQQWHSPSFEQVTPIVNTGHTTTLPPEELARWYAEMFAQYESHRQLQQGLRGPVEAEMRNERKRVSRLRRAEALIEEASRRLREAVDGPSTKEKIRERKAAEVDLARAQGMMDRIRAEDAARECVLPPWLAQYQGPVHGYDIDQGVNRTHYVDAPVIHAPNEEKQWQLPISSDRAPYGSTQAAAAFTTGGAIHDPMQIPTARRAKASSIPTPYGIPEVCFAWDMLLRSTTPTSKLAAKPTRSQSVKGFIGSTTSRSN